MSGSGDLWAEFDATQGIPEPDEHEMALRGQLNDQAAALDLDTLTLQQAIQLAAQFGCQLTLHAEPAPNGIGERLHVHGQFFIIPPRPLALRIIELITHAAGGPENPNPVHFVPEDPGP